MSRGRPRKPVEALKLAGTFRPDRHAERELAPRPAGLPEKPADLAGEAGALWDAVVPELVRIGAVGGIDAFALRAACEAWGLYRAALAKAQADPLDKFARCAVVAYGAMWQAAAAKVGLNPADRLKLRTEPGDKPAGVSGFARQRGAS